MALPPQPVNLEEDLLAQQVPQQQVVPQQQGDFRQNLSPMVTNEMEAFIVELLGVADDVGVIDDAFGQPSIEDQADILDTSADPMQFLNEQQLTSLVQKFLAIPEPDRSNLEQTLRAELPPQISSRIDAVLRFVQQRSQGRV